MRTTTADIRGALRLANQLHDLADDALARRRHLVAGLCTLLNADVGVSLIRTAANGSPARSSVASAGWSDAIQQRAGERHFREHPEPSPLFSPISREAIRNGWAITTQRRLDVFRDDETWSALPLVQQFREKLGLVECLASVFPLGRAGRAAWIFMYRRSMPAFAPRHRELLHAIHGELDWMYRPVRSTGPTEFRTLTVRQRQTLYRLLAGDSEKQVAAGLGLSRHTVHVHVKSLYRTFKVNSRNELLAKFVRPMGK